MSLISNSELPEDVVIQLAIEQLLSQLEAEELQKPPLQRREVPNIPTLAEAANVHRATMYNLVKGNVKHVNLESLSAVYNELRRRGFEVEIGDLLTAYPVSAVKQVGE